ncbi:MAG TPA: branched-chain amino acid ABC transporter permease [Microthrixaceae bacterium]|nr:branched-chain amino acid ABC transporter permease [Microthrixaceae bacterium]
MTDIATPTVEPMTSGSRGFDSQRALRVAPVVVILVLCIVLPLMLSEFWVDRITGWIPLAIAALGLNLLTGYNGQISVGHGALYGLGAYTSAILVGDQGWPLFLAVLGGALVSFAAGVIIGLPALRIRGLYLALVTLSVAVLFPELVRQAEGLTGGTGGYYITEPQVNSRGVVVDRPIRLEAPEWTGLANDQWRFYVFVVIAFACFVLARNLVHSRTGRAMIAIRDNEVAAEVNGVNVARIKVLTFGVGSALAGVGGGLYALWRTQLFPQSFTLLASFYFLVAMVVGGPASIIGPAIGAVFYGFFADVITPELPERVKPATPLILGVLLIVLMRVAPGGVVGLARTTMARFAVARAAPRGADSESAAGEDETASISRSEE